MAQSYPRVHHNDRQMYRNRDDSGINAQDDSPGISRIQQLIQLAVSIVSGLLLLRFLLALFGANPENSFVNVVYSLTSPLVSPFRGLFNLSPTAGSSRFEIEALVATIIYILAGVGIIKLLDIFRQSKS